MKNMFGIVLVAVCLMGCKQEFRDPLIRQQITAMVANLNDEDDSAAKKANEDLKAILAVNSAKLSPEQKKKIESAQLDAMKLASDIALKQLDRNLHPDRPPEKIEGIPELKQKLADAASMF